MGKRRPMSSALAACLVACTVRCPSMVHCPLSMMLLLSVPPGDAFERRHRRAHMRDEPPSTLSSASARKRFGESGERFAAGWLEARGVRIVERNWRCPAGELDLVAERGGGLVFVEVKSRHGERMGAPKEAVSRTNRLRLVA